MFKQGIKHLALAVVGGWHYNTDFKTGPGGGGGDQVSGGVGRWVLKPRSYVDR